MTPTILPNVGLLVLRLVVGTTFIVHGLDKLGDLSAAEDFFAAQAIPAPGLMAPFVSASEALGGVLLIAGLATPLVGAALTVDMLVALFTTHIDQGFLATDGGMELVLVLAGASLAIALAGPGRFSLDATTVGRRYVGVDAVLRLTRRIAVHSRSNPQVKGMT